MTVAGGRGREHGHEARLQCETSPIPCWGFVPVSITVPVTVTVILPVLLPVTVITVVLVMTVTVTEILTVTVFPIAL